MTPLKQLMSGYDSRHAFAKAKGLHAHQVKRWLDNGAMVDDEGNVYIRTKGKVPACTVTGQSSQQDKNNVD